MFRTANRFLFVLITPLFLLAEAGGLRHSKIINYAPQTDSAAIHTGLDLLLAHDCKILKNKNVAIVCNSGSIDRGGAHIIDRLTDRRDFRIVSVIQVSEKEFDTASSGLIYSQADSNHVARILITPGHPVVKQTDLNGANLLLFDLQYIGIRYDINFEILIALLKLSADRRIPLVLLDRPNPLTAAIMEGPLATAPGLTDAAQIPWRFGMTIGELALLINEEGWIDSKNAAPLYLIPMVNYPRREWHDRLDLPWGIPLEKVYTIETLLTYCSTCFYHYTNVSNGPGSLFQYEVGGAPWIGGAVLAERLNRTGDDYVEFSRVSFIPGSRSRILSQNIYLGEECTGIKIKVLDRQQYHTAKVGSYLLGLIAQLYANHFRWLEPAEIDQLFGSTSYRAVVDAKADLRQLYPVWLAELTAFQKLCPQYLLYGTL